MTNDDGRVGSYRSSTYHNYLTDMQGSTTSIVKEDGSLSAAYIYTDFGETTEITGGTSTTRSATQEASMIKRQASTT